MKAVAYYRVSTASQGRSGLGLEAQKAAVVELASARQLSLLAEFTEVESGKRDDRLQLTAALQHAKVTGAVLVIAKLDRLSRNAAFLLMLRDSGVKFIAADIPDANDLTIGVLAVIAQAEREAISRRTKEALQAIRARLERGTVHVSSRTGKEIRRLGNPNGAAPLRRASKGNAAALEAIKNAAHRRSIDLAPIIQELQLSGLSTSYALATALNERGVLTPRRRRWHPSGVRALLERVRGEDGLV